MAFTPPDQDTESVKMEDGTNISDDSPFLNLLLPLFLFCS